MEAAEWVATAARSLARSWETLATALDGRTAREDDVWLADAASPSALLNAATLLRPVPTSGAERLTERLEAFFGLQQTGGPWVLWSAWPTPELAPLGYQSWGADAIMVRLPGGEAPSAPPELRIVEARDAAELAKMERTFVEAFPVRHIEPMLPGAMFRASLLGGPFRIWGGYVGDSLVSVSAALVGDEVIDVSFVATQPYARRRGYGAALTWAATTASPSLPAVLEASSAGRPVYEKMGYREVGRMQMWERPREARWPFSSPSASPQS